MQFLYERNAFESTASQFHAPHHPSLLEGRPQTFLPKWCPSLSPQNSKVVSDIRRPSQMSMASEEGSGSSSKGKNGKRKAFNFPAVKRPR